jgi:hypothetical protein
MYIARKRKTYAVLVGAEPAGFDTLDLERVFCVKLFLKFVF